MQYKSLALASLATAVVSAQSPPTLAEVLQSKTELSSLTQLFGRYPEAAAALANATGITVLAPSNDAFATAFGGSEIKIPDNETALVGAVLSYHVLQETVASSDFSTTPAFVPTFLDAPFTNITDGQVVEGVKNGSDVVIVSGLKSASKVTTAVCSHGTEGCYPNNSSILIRRTGHRIHWRHNSHHRQGLDHPDQNLDNRSRGGVDDPCRIVGPNWLG